MHVAYRLQAKTLRALYTEIAIMYPTTEVRWFLPSEIPSEAARWFESFGPPVDPTSRTDRYLVPSSAIEPGIKVREGRIEVKARMNAHGHERLASGVEGIVESFYKWGFPLTDDSETPQGGWVDVTKTRRLRTFSNESGQVGEFSDHPDSGCTLELGEVQLNGQPWWTVCLEAFGSGEAVRLDLLRATAERVFAGSTLWLESQRSMGYVAWLAASGASALGKDAPMLDHE